MARNTLILLLTIILILILSCKICESSNFNGIIGGNYSLKHCLTGGRPRVSKVFITTTEFIKLKGYKAEEHVVVTEDGHILTLHRIPGKAKAPPVFLQHGILSSSFDWVVTGRGKSLAFTLADQGYDVWLGNARGNTYSRCHTRYVTDEFEFWNFSWHEMGVYDLPAAIGFVTEITNQNIIYIGHSMGTTMFYVMAIERPDIAAKVKAMFSLSPVVYSHNTLSPFKKYAKYANRMEWLLTSTKTYEFLPRTPRMQQITKNLCNLSETQQKMCVNTLFNFVGSNPLQFDYTLLTMMFSNLPAGSSYKCFIHYFQEGKTGRFQYYDEGRAENLKKYNSTVPPDYDVSKIQVPVGLFWSDNDYLAHPEDVKLFYDQLPNKILSYRIEDPLFNHVDYLYAIHASRLLYSKLLSVMENYR